MLTARFLLCAPPALSTDNAYLAEKGAIRRWSDFEPEVHPWINPKPFDASVDWNQRKLLLIRNGGIGDLIMLTPLIREIKQRWPAVEITLCRAAEFGEVLRLNPYVDSFEDYPILRTRAEEFDAIVEFEETAIYQSLQRQVPMFELFGAVLGIAISDPASTLVIADEDLAWASAHYPRHRGIRRIFIQLDASNVARSYPPRLLKEVLRLLDNDSTELFLAGGYRDHWDPITSLRIHLLRGTFMQSVALATLSDALLVPDSSFVHVAGALGLPAVALYGPFPPTLRTASYSTVEPIMGKLACAPCFHHTRNGEQFPAIGPCNVSGNCDALASISPERIANEVKRLIENV